MQEMPFKSESAIQRKMEESAAGATSPLVNAAPQYDDGEDFPIPQVQDQMKRLANEVCRAEEVIGTMASRLASVLRQCPAEDVNRDPVEPLTPLAEDIRYCTDRLRDVTDGYLEILNRLEL